MVRATEVLKESSARERLYAEQVERKLSEMGQE
jgi:hypothetical protein